MRTANAPLPSWAHALCNDILDGLAGIEHQRDTVVRKAIGRDFLEGMQRTQEAEAVRYSWVRIRSHREHETAHRACEGLALYVSRYPTRVHPSRTIYQSPRPYTTANAPEGPPLLESLQHDLSPQRLPRQNVATTQSEQLRPQNKTNNSPRRVASGNRSAGT